MDVLQEIIEGSILKITKAEYKTLPIHAIFYSSNACLMLS